MTAPLSKAQVHAIEALGRLDMGADPRRCDCETCHLVVEYYGDRLDERLKLHEGAPWRIPLGL